MLALPFGFPCRRCAVAQPQSRIGSQQAAVEKLRKLLKNSRYGVADKSGSKKECSFLKKRTKRLLFSCNVPASVSMLA
jgi:hypothetical protein